MLPLLGRTLHTTRYEEPLRLLESARRHAPLMPQARRLIELREILQRVLRIPRAMLLESQTNKQGNVFFLASNGAIACRISRNSIKRRACGMSGAMPSG